jgi:hypothetical protein
LAESCKSRRQGDKARSRREKGRGSGGCNADGRKKRRQKEKAAMEGRSGNGRGGGPTEGVAGQRKKKKKRGNSLTVCGPQRGVEKKEEEELTADRHEGLYQISDQPVLKQLRKMYPK